MWDNITQDLSVNQIASHVGVNRRSLERAFRRDLGRGINQEYQRRRLEKAGQLLIQTDLSIADVSTALGFNAHTYFCRVFREAYGVSPAQYRRENRP